eukprot:293044_1
MDAILSKTTPTTLPLHLNLNAIKKKDRFKIHRFLRACNNFNSNVENISLLIYGYIFSVVKPELIIYQQFFRCTCIMNIISSYFMNDLRNSKKQKWNTDNIRSLTTNGHQVRASRWACDNMKFECDFTRLKVVKYGYGECVSIPNKIATTIRQLWKLQIVSSEPNELMLSHPISVGIDFYDRRYHWFFQDMIRNGDIISILFLQYGTDKNVLKCAVNSKQYAELYTNINVSSLSSTFFQLFVSWCSNMEFHMLTK